MDLSNIDPEAYNDMVLGVLLLEYATTEYAREEADGISGRETE